MSEENDKIFIEPIAKLEEEPIVEEIKKEEPAIEEEKSEAKIDRRKGKSKRVLTPEQKAKLVENLAKGRAKSLETRRRNRELKKIEKDSKITNDEKIILDSLKKKENKSKSNNELLDKIAELQNKLNEKEKAKPKLEVIPEVENDEDVIDKIDRDIEEFTKKKEKLIKKRPKVKVDSQKVKVVKPVETNVDVNVELQNKRIQDRKLMDMLKNLR